MEQIYSRMGTVEFPDNPVFVSVMRQVSFSYALHGLGLWVIGTDVVRYRPLVVLTAIGYLIAVGAFVAIDWNSSLPWPWTAGNAGGCLAVGTVLSILLWAETRWPEHGATSGDDLAHATSSRIEGPSAPR